MFLRLHGSDINVMDWNNNTASSPSVAIICLIAFLYFLPHSLNVKKRVSNIDPYVFPSFPSSPSFFLPFLTGMVLQEFEGHQCVTVIKLLKTLGDKMENISKLFACVTIQFVLVLVYYVVDVIVVLKDMSLLLLLLLIPSFSQCFFSDTWRYITVIYD